MANSWGGALHHSRTLEACYRCACSSPPIYRTGEERAALFHRARSESQRAHLERRLDHHYHHHQGHQDLLRTPSRPRTLTADRKTKGVPLPLAMCVVNPLQAPGPVPTSCKAHPAGSHEHHTTPARPSHTRTVCPVSSYSFTLLMLWVALALAQGWCSWCRASSSTYPPHPPRAAAGRSSCRSVTQPPLPSSPLPLPPHLPPLS